VLITSRQDHSDYVGHNHARVRKYGLTPELFYDPDKPLDGTVAGVVLLERAFDCFGGIEGWRQMGLQVCGTVKLLIARVPYATAATLG
jgi:hypothetical protein